MTTQHSSRNMQLTLDIFEIRANIARFIRQRDLLSCTLVCKAWHDSFEPLIWHTVRLHDTGAKRVQTREAFEKHSRMVRDLDVSCEVNHAFLGIAASCTNLTTLCIHLGCDLRLGVDLTPIISANKGLATLEIHCFVPSKVYGLSLDTSLPRLKNLNLLNVELLPGQAIPSAADESLHEQESTFDLFQTVETLHLDRTIFPPVDLVQLPREPLQRIKYLSLSRLLSSSVSPFLGQFFGPNLNHVAWAGRCDKTVHSRLIELFLQRPFKFLEKLELQTLEHYQDPSLVAVFQSFKAPLQVLDCSKVEFTEKSWRYLTSHGIHLTLSQLRLDRCVGISSHIVQDILEQCPNLVRVDVPKLDASHIWDRQWVLNKKTTWACTGLRSLGIDFIFNEDQNATDVFAIQRAVHREIGALHQLQSLSIAGWGEGAGLSMRLDEGLETWVDLVNLKELDVGWAYSCMEMEDMIWLRDHLKSLTSLKGKLSWDEQLDRQLQSFFYKKEGGSDSDEIKND